MDKIYWSNTPSEKWDDEGDFLTFFLIPNKWGSIKAWKFAFSMRAEMLNKGLMTLNGEAKK